MEPSYSKYTKDWLPGQHPFERLPAVAIGGPPHSGKSVLAYSLTRALRAREVPHYVIRAYPPDGEGDWFQAGARAFVRHVRVKGARSEAWLPLLIRDVANRHLPLIVDMGGLPTVEQEALLDACTHAVLLTRDAASHDAWAARMTRHGLPLLADLHSDLTGTPAVETAQPVLQGTLTGLERGTMASGPAFAALVDRLAALFLPATEGLRRRHLTWAPVELAVDLERLAAHFELDPHAWPPGALPEVLAYLPRGRPLGLYGRGPNWLYAAVALHAVPAAFYLFDVRLGWVRAPELPTGDPADSGLWRVTSRTQPTSVRWDVRLLDAYLDYRQAPDLRLPAPPADRGLMVSGQLPLWLWAALARAGAVAPWVSVVQPQLCGAVVVRGGAPYAPGTVVPLRVP
jgi:CRISPR-associated protein Csx3